MANLDTLHSPAMAPVSRDTVDPRPRGLLLANPAEFRIFLLLMAVFALLTKALPESANDSSRLDQIEALVERRSFVIDDPGFPTIDKYLYEGHFYSDKPPILAILASPVYAVIRSLGFGLRSHWPACWGLTVAIIGGLSALGLVAFRRVILEAFPISTEWADFTTLVAALGTTILPFSVVFNNHVVSGTLMFLGFQPLLVPGRCGAKEALRSGLILSLAGAMDISCFLFVLVAAVLFARESLWNGIVLSLAAAPLSVFYLLLNYWTSGSLRPPSMNAPLWNYPGSIFGESTLSGLAHHATIGDLAVYAYHMLVGARGLISHSPILIVSLIALPLVLGKNSPAARRGNLAAVLLACAAFIAFYILRTTNYAGGSFGPRWYVTVMLCLCLPLAALEPTLRSSPAWRRAFVGLVVISVAIALIGVAAPWTRALDPDQPGYPSNSVLVAADVLKLADRRLQFKILVGAVEAAALLGWAWAKWRKQAADAPVPAAVPAA
jgi:hypothetical protein